jgi:itaconate CoA-transferase
MSLPLEGLLVVSVEQAVAAPYAASRLADAGARVIKIERPEGDFSRGYDHVVMGDSTYFVWLNRGKESVVLDFAKADDLALLRAMIGRADVLIQNLGPGAATRAGFGWEAMRAINPRLITCDISGYGEEGPLAKARAYDLLVQAESGIASVTGTPDAPGRIGVSATDVGTGMYAHAAILEALVKRSITGQGSAIRVSMFDAMTDWMAVPILHYDYAKTIWPRVGLGHPTITPYGAFPTRDGQSVLLAVQNEGEWQRLAIDALGRPDIAADPRYASNGERVKNKTQVDADIAAITVTMDADTLRQKLTAAKLAFASVNGVPQVAAHPHLRRITVKTPHGDASFAAPPAIVRGETREYGPVPSLGQHTDAVRAEFAGR